MTGPYANTGAIVHKVASLFQPAIRTLLEDRVSKAYAGRWSDIRTGGHKGEITSAEVKIINGGLYLVELIIRGYDVLKIIENADISFHKPYPVPLWNTGRPGEFRSVPPVLPDLTFD